MKRISPERARREHWQRISAASDPAAKRAERALERRLIRSGLGYGTGWVNASQAAPGGKKRELRAPFTGKRVYPLVGIRRW